MAARSVTFPAVITAVVITTLQAFWICPHYFDRSMFEFSRFFSLSSMDSSATTVVASSTVAVVQATPEPPSTMDITLSDTSSPPVIFNEFLKWYEDRQNSCSTVSVAHTGIFCAGLTHSNSLGSWVLDSGATDHITGNKSLFSSFSTSSHLPSITMTNGSKISSHGIGTIHLFPSLSIDNVLYVPRSPFNLLSVSRLTRSLDCVVSFTKDFVCLQDRSSERIIGTGCESHGIYYLRTTAHVGTVTDSPSFLHVQLGHLSLPRCSNLFQIYPSCPVYLVSRVF